MAVDKWLIPLALITGMTVCAHTVAAEENFGELTAEELAVEDPSKPVLATDVKEVVLEGVLEFGYQDEQGRYVIDIFERDRAYLGIKILTPDGRPVVGAVPNIAIEGSSQLVLNELMSDEVGIMRFEVVGGDMGLDTVSASIGDSKIEYAINVISLRAAGFPTPKEIEGGIPWSELMQARLDYEGFNLVATFPESVQKRSGQTVKLSGFMMPLQPEQKQSHFLLTSNPPSCFFHIPGGPAGSVEVLAPEGIEVSWGPVVVEGRFEPQKSSNMGVVYRLLDAKLVAE